MSAWSKLYKKPFKKMTLLESAVICVYEEKGEEVAIKTAEELHALQERVKELEKVKDIAQKIYDVSEQDGRYGDGSYALVLRDEYENSALLVKLGETLESMKVSA